MLSVVPNQRNSQSRIFLVLAIALVSSFVFLVPAAKADTSKSPVGIVVAIDESGSLKSLEVNAEKVAARAVLDLPLEGLGVFGGIIAFSDEVRNLCPDDGSSELLELPLTPEVANECVDRAQLRPKGNTNHAAAINRAVELLNGKNTKDSKTKIILLMTDGVYDPDGSTTAELDDPELTAALKSAKDSGVQIWPVGFGDVSEIALSYYANSGAGANTSCDDAKTPAPLTTNTPNELQEKLLQILSGSICKDLSVGLDELEIPVHPFLDSFTVQVRPIPGVPVGLLEVKDSKGKDVTELCKDKKDLGQGVSECTFDEPYPSGTWTARANGSLIVSSREGKLTLEVTNCNTLKESSEGLPNKISVKPDADRQVSWIDVKGKDDVSLTAEVALESDTIPETIVLERESPQSGIWSAPLKDSKGKAGTIKITGVLATPQLWLEQSSPPCKFSGQAGNAGKDESSSGGGFPFWIILLLLAAAIAVIGALWYRRRQRMLPGSNVKIINISGDESIEQYLESSTKWSLDANWDLPSLSPSTGVGNITITKDVATGRLRISSPGMEDVVVDIGQIVTLTDQGEILGDLLVKIDIDDGEDTEDGIFNLDIQSSGESSLFD